MNSIEKVTFYGKTKGLKKKRVTFFARGQHNLGERSWEE